MRTPTWCKHLPRPSAGPSGRLKQPSSHWAFPTGLRWSPTCRARGKGPQQEAKQSPRGASGEALPAPHISLTPPGPRPILPNRMAREPAQIQRSWLYSRLNVLMGLEAYESAFLKGSSGDSDAQQPGLRTTGFDGVSALPLAGWASVSSHSCCLWSRLGAETRLPRVNSRYWIKAEEQTGLRFLHPMTEVRVNEIQH